MNFLKIEQATMGTTYLCINASIKNPLNNKRSKQAFVKICQ